MSPRVAIVIVTFNAEQYLGDLFASIAADTFPKERLGIFVVDNASTDGTIARIANYGLRITNLRVIRNEKNEGFAKGNNIGIRRAMDEGYEWIALLNQDTIVNGSPSTRLRVDSSRGSESSWLTELLKVGESDPHIAAVQPLLALWPPERGEVNSLGNEIHFLGFGFSRGYHTSVKAKLRQKEITYSSGAAVLLRAGTLRDVGLFNEDLFMYHEDLDLGWRLWLRGWKSVLAPTSIVYHKYNFKAVAYKYYYMERNRLIVLLQNYKWPTLLLITPAWLVMECGLIGYSFVKGWWREKLRGYWWVLTHLSTIFKTRTMIQKNRLISDRAIVNRFVGAISYQEINNPVLRWVANPVFSLFWGIARRLIWW